MAYEGDYLATIISYQYPGSLDAGLAAVYAEEGTAPYIGHWDEEVLGPVPTDEQLYSWEIPAVRNAKRTEIRRESEASYREIWTLDGEFQQSERDTLAREEQEQGYDNLSTGKKAQIDERDALLAQRQTLLQQVNTAATANDLAAIEAINWTWDWS